MFALVPSILVDASEKPEQFTAKSIRRRLEWDLCNWEKQLNSIWAAKNGRGWSLQGRVVVADTKLLELKYHLVQYWKYSFRRADASM